MADLAQQIRERLDGWAPPAGEAPGPPFVEIVGTGHLTPEQIEAWQQEWDRLLEEARHQPMQLLVHQTKFYPGFEQMRDALLAALELHDEGDGHLCPAEIVGYSVQRWHDADDPCPTKVAIAEKLGIEVHDG